MTSPEARRLVTVVRQEEPEPEYVRVAVVRHDPGPGEYRRVVFAPREPDKLRHIDVTLASGTPTAYRIETDAASIEATRSGHGFEPAVEAILAEYQRAIRLAQQRALAALAKTTDDERHGLPVDMLAYFLPAESETATST